MKKIFIASHCMEIGGAEKALLGILNSIDQNEYKVDLFLYRQVGELIKDIPIGINLLNTNKASCLAIPMVDLIKSFKLDMLYGRLKGKLLSKRFVKNNNLSGDHQVELTYSHKYTYKYIEKINEDTVYDLAISFLTPHYIVRNKEGKMVIYEILENGEETEYELTDISIEYLTDTDKLNMEKGVRINGKQELKQYIEDFE